jgi:hypothetical protein
MRMWFEDGPVLAVWIDDNQLDELDTMRAPGLCANPWVRTDIDEWKTNWNPSDMRTGEPRGSQETVTNPVVARALQSPTSAVNVGTGLFHPSDKGAAMQMFKVLRRPARTTTRTTCARGRSATAGLPTTRATSPSSAGS